MKLCQQMVLLMQSAFEKVKESTRQKYNEGFDKLKTFDFQAKEFYLKHGYEVFGVLEDCPADHQRYYLKKKI